MSRFAKQSMERLQSFISRHSLLSILALASLVRLVGLGYECLWYDEAFTSKIASLPLLRALEALAGDIHPPLYYMFEWVTVRVLGNNAFALRLPSAIFGVLVVYQVYRVAQLTLNEKLVSWSALAVAVMPVQLYYSQEARMYTLLTWLVLYAITAILEKRYAWSIAALVLAMYTQNLGFLYAVTLGSWMLVRSRFGALKHAWVGLAYLPWLPTMYLQATQLGGGFWIVPHGLGQLAYQFIFTTFGFRLPTWLQTHVLVLAALLTCAGVWQLRRDRRAWPLALLAFGPPALMWIVSALWVPVTLERALLPSGVASVLLWVVGIGGLSRYYRWVVAGVGLPVLLLSIVAFVVIDKDDFRGVANRVAELSAGNEAVYHTSVSSIIFLAHYIDTDNHYIMPQVGDLSQSLTERSKIAMGIKQREATIEDLVRLGYRRAWILIAISPSSNDSDTDRAWQITRDWPVLQRVSLIDNRFGTFDAVQIALDAPRGREWISYPKPR